MQPFRKHSGVVVPLDKVNVDTDQIIPKQFLKRIERTGFGQFLFYDWRFSVDGNKIGDFVLHAPRYAKATILVAGKNFGCGSSREHAVWALMDYGFRVIIASSFADIFANNSLKNGLLTVRLNDDQVAEITRGAKEIENYELTVDLEDLRIEDPRRIRPGVVRVWTFAPSCWQHYVPRYESANPGALQFCDRRGGTTGEIAAARYRHSQVYRKRDCICSSYRRIHQRGDSSAGLRRRPPDHSAMECR